MLKGLFISEDKFLLDRIRTGFADKKGYEYLFAQTSEEAVELSKCGDIAVCAMTLSMSIMDGNELAQIVADDNPDVRFIFIYEEVNTETAVNLFNDYEMSRIIPRDSFSVEILSEMFDKEVELYNAEENLRIQARAHRDKDRRDAGKPRNAGFLPSSGRGAARRSGHGTGGGRGPDDQLQRRERGACSAAPDSA